LNSAQPERHAAMAAQTTVGTGVLVDSCISVRKFIPLAD
jgi:hypothetical protein